MYSKTSEQNLSYYTILVRINVTSLIQVKYEEKKQGTNVLTIIHSVLSLNLDSYCIGKWLKSKRRLT